MPTVQGFTSPDPCLVDAAERYAESVGITLGRQPEYVKIDEDRSRRLADAYAAMEHAQKDSAGKEAYESLTRQAVAQYQALGA